MFFPVTVTGLLQRIASEKHASCQSTLLRLVHAVAWYYRCSLLSFPKEDKKTLINLVKRRGVLEGTQPRQRGALHGALFADLLTYVSSHGTADEVWDLEVKYYSGLRTEEAGTVTFSMLNMDSSGCLFFDIAKSHDPSAAMHGRKVERHYFDARFSLRLMCEPTTRRGDTRQQRLVRVYDTGRLVALIREASLHYHWDQQFMWDLHALRHGAATEAALQADKDQRHAAVARVTGQVSKTVTSTYSRTNPERVEKTLKHQAKTATARAMVGLGQLVPKSPKKAARTKVTKKTCRKR